MATATVKGANVTLIDAGGSGDNIVAQGQIKTVEKVWLDNYTLTSNVTLTNTTIELAQLPEGGTITSVEVMIETSASQTDQTIALGFSSDADAAGWGSLLAATVITHNGTVSTIKLPESAQIGGVVADTTLAAAISTWQVSAAGTKNTVALKLNNWTATTGTIKSIVRYT